MDATTVAAIEELIANQTGARSRIANVNSVGGGCISHAQSIVLDDHRKFFVKLNSVELQPMFASEAIGLQAIANVECIRVPKLIGLGASARASFLILENIASSKRCSDFFERLGRGLAHLHREGTGKQFGFESNNFIGSSVQPNSFSNSWVEFWAENRLGFQLKLARENGLGGDELQKCGDRMISRLDDLIGNTTDPPALIHGDLWSGNYMEDESGEPVLIDPAVYYGHREAEFGMTTLFGGFGQQFYDAYDEVWPLSPGSTQRIEIYRLYHLLNHLNLFGTGYLGGCLEILRKYS